MEFIHRIQRRVSYGETDQMGYLYYGKYADYYETGRTEALRSAGLIYKELEESGISMPVISMEIRYRKSAYYDDLLTIETAVRERPGLRIRFEYRIYNEGGELLNEGKTELVFYDRERRRVVEAPEGVLVALGFVTI